MSDHEQGRRTQQHERPAGGGSAGGGAGKSTLTSRLGPSPSAIARAVVAQMKAAESPAAVQAHGDLDGPDVHALAAQGTAGGGGTLPFLDQIQRAFGHHDVSGVRAHVGGAAAEASAAMGARAYAAGDAVAFADTPDLHLAAHEAAHVVQQRGGVRLSDGVGRAGDEYERHADAVADAVVRGDSAQALLDGMAHRGAAGGPAVQRELIPVQWGNTMAGDDSTLELTPLAEVWVNGRLSQPARDIRGNTETVRVEPGQSGHMRVRLRVRYFIDNNFVNDDGGVEQLGVMSFRCDASGTFVWGDDLSVATPPPTTSAFQVTEASASGSGERMTAVFRFAGPQHSVTNGGTGGAGLGDLLPGGNAGVSGSRQTQNPAGTVSRRYVLTVVGPTSFGSAAGEGAGGGTGSSTSSATATGAGGRADAQSTATGGNANANGGAGGTATAAGGAGGAGGQGGNATGGQGGNATGGSATASPTINITVPSQQSGQSPGPAEQSSSGSSGVLDRIQVHFNCGDSGADPMPSVDQELRQWVSGLREDARAAVRAGRATIRILGYASDIGTSARNRSLSEQRARHVEDILRGLFADSNPQWDVRGLGSTSDPQRGGAQCDANMQRVEVRIVAS